MVEQAPGTTITRVDSKRGLDGLTPEELHASRRGWWDESFTHLLLRWIPPATRRLLDIGCGLGTAAHAVMPSLTNARYLGIDSDEERLRQANALLVDTSYAGRVRFQVGRAERLPYTDSSVDLVLASMTLQHISDVPRVLSEVKRILHTGGRFLAIEPDNLANEFYFDGPLEEINAAIRRLFAGQRFARRPADLAIGPAVPSLLEQAGLAVIDCRPYALGRMSRLSLGELLDRVRRVVTITAAQINLSDNPALQNCLAAIDRAAGTGTVTNSCVGYGGQVAPVFVTVADRR